MREHIEMLIQALGSALRGGGAERTAVRHRRGPMRAAPKRRRPRVARSTYVPLRREAHAPMRYAH